MVRKNVQIYRKLKNAFKSQKTETRQFVSERFYSCIPQTELSLSSSPQAKGSLSPSIEEGIMFRSGFFHDFLQFLSSPISLSLFL